MPHPPIIADEECPEGLDKNQRLMALDWLACGMNLDELAVRMGLEHALLRRLVDSDAELAAVIERVSARMCGSAPDFMTEFRPQMRMATEHAVRGGVASTLNLVVRLSGMLRAEEAPEVEPEADIDEESAWEGGMPLDRLARMTPEQLAQWWWILVQEGSPDHLTAGMPLAPPETFIHALNGLNEEQTPYVAAEPPHGHTPPAATDDDEGQADPTAEVQSEQAPDGTPAEEPDSSSQPPARQRSHWQAPPAKEPLPSHYRGARNAGQLPSSPPWKRR